MKFTVDNQEKYSLITLNESKLDATISPNFKAELVKLNSEKVKNFILDFQFVKYVDSSGLSAILVGNRLCQDAEGVMILCGINDHVMKLIKISQLNTILEILPTVQEGIDAIFMSELEKDFGKEN